MPGSPRIFVIWSLMVDPSTLSPSTARTWSPDWIPASSAGVPASGATTTRRQVSLKDVHAARSAGSSVFVIAISAPMPPKLPDRSPSACWYCSGGM